MSTTQLWLYEHEDGRHLAAPAGAEILAGDPAWHRVGPVEVQGVEATSKELPNDLQSEALTDERIDYIADITARGMEDGIRGFMKTWGWRQFARNLLDACGARAVTAPAPVAREPLTGTGPPEYQAGWKAGYKHGAWCDKRDPLTDAEIDAVTRAQWGPSAIFAAFRAYARTIEKAHGITPKGST